MEFWGKCVSAREILLLITQTQLECVVPAEAASPLVVPSSRPIWRRFASWWVIFRQRLLSVKVQRRGGQFVERLIGRRRCGGGRVMVNQ